MTAGKPATRGILFFVFSVVFFSAHGQWAERNNGLYGGLVLSLTANSTNVFAGTSLGVYVSSNNGSSWTKTLATGSVSSMAANGSTVFAVGGAVWRSLDNGSNWTLVKTGFIYSVAISGTNIFIGTNEGIFLSTNNGTGWTAVNTGLTDLDVTALAISGTNIYAGTGGGGVFLSTNNGANWSPVNTNLTNLDIRSIAVSGANLFAGTWGGGVFRSTNNGSSWTAVNTGVTNLHVYGLVFKGSNLFLGTNQGLFLSTNNGASWTAVSSGLPSTRIQALTANSTNVFAGTNGGVSTSTNNGSNWTTVNTGIAAINVHAYVSIGDDLFAATFGSGVVKSSDNGDTWVPVNTGLTNLFVRDLQVSGANMFAATDAGGVFRSTDNGSLWTAVNTGLTNLRVSHLAVNGTHVFAGTQSGVFYSANSGTSWTLVNTGLTDTGITALEVKGSNVFAGTSTGVFRSANNGTNWTAVNTGLTSQFVQAFITMGSNLFVGTSSGVFRSSNDGTNWSAVNTGLGTLNAYSFAVSGSTLFVGNGGSAGLYLSLNNGTNWTSVYSGLPGGTTYSLGVHGGQLFASPNSAGAWARPLTNFTPSISSFSPVEGPVGTSVTITGTNFNPTASSNIVYFGAVKAVVTNASSSQLTVTVPTGATYEPIYATVNGLTAYSDKPFQVTFQRSNPIDGNAFSAGVDFAVGSLPDPIHLCDLDGDGRSDIIVLNTGSGSGTTVSVLRNTSTSGALTVSSFAGKIDFTTGRGPLGVATADFDGDNKPDMVVTNFNDNSVSVFRNTSTAGSITSASFATKVDFAVGSFPRDVAAADIDRDGKPDLAVTGSPGVVSILKNTSTTGSISFASKLDFATANSPFSVLFADVDGDGKKDLAVGCGSTGNAISVLRNTSAEGTIDAGSFAAKVDLALGEGGNTIVAADIDEDGKTDLISAGTNVCIFRNMASSGAITTASFAPILKLTGLAPADVTIGDMDGDGKPDIVVPSESNNRVAVLRNISSSGSLTTASFAARADITVTGATALSVGDLDGDNLPDFAVSNRVGGVATVLRNIVKNAQSDIIHNAGFTPTSNINYSTASNQSGDLTSSLGTQVAQFIIRDGGGGSDVDASPTTLTSVVFAATNAENIRKAALYDGTTELAEVSGGEVLTFTGLSLTAADNGSKTFSLRISYQAVVTDNTQNQFIITSATANTTGSGFSSADAGGAASLTTTDYNRVAVTATKLRFVQQPTDVHIGASMLPEVSVEAVDALNNRDMDMAGTVGLTSSGSLEGTVSSSLNEGFCSFADLIHTASATGRTLTTTNALGLTNASSITFNVAPFTTLSDIIVNASFIYPVNIDYSTANNQVNTLTSSTGTEIAQFVLRDGGSSADADGASTQLTAIVFSVTNSSSLRKVALFNGVTNVMEVVAGPTLTFTGLALNAPDNGSAHFTLRASFNADVTDNAQSQFTITQASASVTGSGFLNATAGGAQTSISGDNNRIEVSASRIVYTTQPPSVAEVNQDLSVSPVLEARDALDNKDIDYSGTVTVSNSSSLAMTNTPAAFSSGDLSFPGNFQFTAFGTATITVQSDGLTPATSSAIVIRAEEPVAQPSDLVFTEVGQTTLGVGFTAAADSPDGYLALRKADAAPTGLPDDGVQYDPGDPVGDAVVVHAGTALAFDDSGLSAGTPYFYKVFAFNGASASINYLVAEAPDNVAQHTTLPATPNPSVSPADTDHDSFKVTWPAVPGATSYELEVSDNDFVDLLDGYDPAIITDGLDIVVAGLSPNTIYKFRLRARSDVGYSPFSTTSSVETTEATNPGNPLAFKNSNAAIQMWTAGTPSTKITTRLSGGSGARQVTFFHRGILEVDFTPVIATPVSADDYEVTVAADMLDDFGLEYYFRAGDETTAELFTERSFIYLSLDPASPLSVPGLSAGGKPENYRIISIPYQLDNKSAQVIFSAAGNFGDKGTWRLVRYENGKNVDVQPFAEIKQGWSYWFNTVKPVDIVLGEGTVPQFNQSKPFTMNLAQGWNQIGDPYPFDIAWDDVRSQNPSLTLSTLKVYDPVAIGLKTADVLEPWSGGFVFADEGGLLTLPVTLRSSSGGRKSGHDIQYSTIDAPEWIVPLTLKHGVGENAMIGIGMHPGASESKDKFDEITPPRFWRYLEMDTRHDDFFAPYFTRDVVPTSGQYTWNFTVRSNFGPERAVLSWDALALSPHAAKLFLYDVDEQHLIDMKVVGEYSFAVREGKNLKFIFANDGYEWQPDFTTLAKPYPNPSSGDVTIPLIVQHDATPVSIDVLDMMGRPVRKLVSQTYGRGIFDINWNRDDDHSEKLPTGIYFIQMKVGSGTQKIMHKLLIK